MPPVKDRFILGLTVGGIITSILILMGPTLLAQFNQSGGGPTAVTITSGTVTANAGTNLNTSLLALDSTVAKDATLSTIDTDIKANIVLKAGANIIGKIVPATACGTTVASQALAAIPTSAAVVFSSTTCLISLFIENSNSGTQTVTITDNAGTPLNAVGPAFIVPGLSNMIVPFDGIAFTSGVKWTAGGTGVLGGMIGYQ